jgi:prevent-host-death family protein
MDRVGVAELKAGLSAYLARVKAGESVTVTDHGRPIARLVPIPVAGDEADDRLLELERLGLLRRGRVPLSADFWELPRPTDAAGRSLAFLLVEREDRT